MDLIAATSGPLTLSDVVVCACTISHRCTQVFVVEEYRNYFRQSRMSFSFSRRKYIYMPFVVHVRLENHDTQLGSQLSNDDIITSLNPLDRGIWPSVDLSLPLADIDLQPMGGHVR